MEWESAEEEDNESTAVEVDENVDVEALLGGGERNEAETMVLGGEFSGCFSRFVLLVNLSCNRDASTRGMERGVDGGVPGLESPRTPPNSQTSPIDAVFIGRVITQHFPLGLGEEVVLVYVSVSASIFFFVLGLVPSLDFVLVPLLMFFTSFVLPPPSSET